LNIWNKFCCFFYLLTLSTVTCLAQTYNGPKFQENTLIDLKMMDAPILAPQPLYLSPIILPSHKFLQKNDNGGGYRLTFSQESPNYLGSISLLRPDFAIQHQPFFCTQEYKIEKATGIPLRFRVGSLQECDWLEGKAGAVQP
jgi:hypothetical protein